jgi:glycosyltransferase involved in cell wall biosynthesis
VRASSGPFGTIGIRGRSEHCRFHLRQPSAQRRRRGSIIRPLWPRAPVHTLHLPAGTVGTSDGARIGSTSQVPGMRRRGFGRPDPGRLVCRPKGPDSSGPRPAEEHAMKPKRIALVTQSYSSGGGVSTVAHWLHDGLTAGGYDVDIHDLATSSRDAHSRRVLVPHTWLRPSLRNRPADGGHLTRWGANAVEIETMRYRPRRELTRVLRGYDLIQVVSGSPAVAAAVVGIGIPVLLAAASPASVERQRRLDEETGVKRLWRSAMTSLTSRLEKFAIRNVDAVFVMNSSMVEYGRLCGQRRVIKAPPGVDAATFSPSPEGWNRRGYLLSVCRLNDIRKGLERMVRAYAQMVDQDPSVPDLVLAGLTQLPNSTLDLIADLGISLRVKIHSNVPPNALVTLYRGASIFLQTSYEEGFGMSVVEAMACGLPAVCTDTDGSREVVADGVTGWLVPQIAGSHLTHLVADRVFHVLRGDGGTMGARARERVEMMFSTEVTLKRYTSLYDELLATRNS